VVIELAKIKLLLPLQENACHSGRKFLALALLNPSVTQTTTTPYTYHTSRNRLTLPNLSVTLAYQSCTSYLSSTVSHYSPTRSLRSADTQLLTVPRSRLVVADRGFYIAGSTE